MMSCALMALSNFGDESAAAQIAATRAGSAGSMATVAVTEVVTVAVTMAVTETAAEVAAAEGMAIIAAGTAIVTEAPATAGTRVMIGDVTIRDEVATAVVTERKELKTGDDVTTRDEVATAVVTEWKTELKTGAASRGA